MSYAVQSLLFAVEVTGAPPRRTATRRRVKVSARQLILPLWMPEDEAIEVIVGMPLSIMPHRVIDELRLALRVQRGEEPYASNAIRELREQMHGMLYATARGFAVSSWTAADILDEFNHKFWKVVYNYRYQPKASLMALVNRALVNWLIQEVRSRSRREKRVVATITVDGTITDCEMHISGDDLEGNPIQAASQSSAMEDVLTEGSLEDLSLAARVAALYCIRNGKFPPQGYKGWSGKARSSIRSEIAQWLNTRALRLDHMAECAPISYFSQEEASDHVAEARQKGVHLKLWLCLRCGFYHVSSVTQ